MRTIFLIAVTHAVVFAADSPAAESSLPISLKRAVEIALAPEGSPKVALAEESIKLAETQKAEARSAFLPDLESSLSDRRETANLRAFGFSFNIPARAWLLDP